MTEYLCPRCGKPMTLLDNDIYEDYGETIQCFDFVCDECDMEFGASVPETKSKSQIIGNQGFGKCPFCGGYLGFSADFMCSEITGEELSEEDDTLVQELFCPKCGASLTAYYPKE